MRGKTLSSLLLTLILVAAACQVPANEATSAANTDVLRQHIHLQGRMLLSYLRRAKQAGLSGDPWGMDYALQEAGRQVHGLRLAYRRLQGPAQSSKAEVPDNAGKQQEVPLEEALDIDTSLPSGAWEQQDEPAHEVGAIPLEQVSDTLEKAHRSLQSRPPALGAALIATNQALGQIRWRQGLEPLPWVKARDQLLKAYALTLDSRPGAQAELVKARDLLAALPEGKVYARYLTDLLNYPVADRWALRSVLRQVDTQVELLRDSAEQSRFDDTPDRPRQP